METLPIDLGGGGGERRGASLLWGDRPQPGRVRFYYVPDISQHLLPYSVGLPPHCNENPIYVFLSWNSKASAPISTFMCLWTIYIVPGLINRINKTLGRPKSLVRYSVSGFLVFKIGEIDGRPGVLAPTVQRFCVILVVGLSLHKSQLFWLWCSILCLSSYLWHTAKKLMAYSPYPF